MSISHSIVQAFLKIVSPCPQHTHTHTHTHSLCVNPVVTSACQTKTTKKISNISSTAQSLGMEEIHARDADHLTFDQGDQQSLIVHLLMRVHVLPSLEFRNFCLSCLWYNECFIYWINNLGLLYILYSLSVQCIQLKCDMFLLFTDTWSAKFATPQNLSTSFSLKVPAVSWP